MPIKHHYFLIIWTVFLKKRKDCLPAEGKQPELYLHWRSCFLSRSEVAILSPSIDPVLLQRAQPQGWSLMDLSQLFCLSGFVKASWLQSCHIPRLGQGLCSCKGPGTLSPQTSGLTDSRFYREPTKLCSAPMVLNKVRAETERALGISSTGCSSEAARNKDSAPVCAKSCDLACFLTSVHSDSKHLTFLPV